MWQVSAWQSTETLISQAFTVDPNNWAAHEMAGSLRLYTGHLDEAFEHYQFVLKYRPRHTEALGNLGWIYQCRGEWELAERYYRQALATDPALATATYSLVGLLERQGRIAEAADCLEAYTAKRPEDATMRCELGVVYARQGRAEPARSQFVQALALAPDDLRARHGLAVVLVQMGRGDEARPHLEIVLSRQPDNANAHVMLGVVLENAGEFAAARDHFAVALQLKPDDKEARDHLQTVEQCLAGASAR
jgi:Flp pilus assembly protein TadD